MAKQMMAGEEDMDSLYPSDEKPAAETEQKPTEEDENAETAVIDNKILSPHGEPLKPGDEIVVQVVKNYGTESEVKYAPHKKDEGGKNSDMDDADKEIESMDNPGMTY